MTTQALIKQNTSIVAYWNDDEVGIIKNMICPGISDTQLELFSQVCKDSGLSPFGPNKEIYPVLTKQKERDAYGKPTGNYVQVLSIFPGIDGFRRKAIETGEYEGATAPTWYDDSGKAFDVWLDEKKPPFACKVGIWRKGFREPAWGIVKWSEVVKTWDGKPQGFYDSAPANQIAIRAEMQGFRRAFPLLAKAIDTHINKANTEDTTVTVTEVTPEVQDDCRKKFFAIGQGTPLQSDKDARAKFMSEFTNGAFTSLGDFVKQANPEQMDALHSAADAWVENYRKEGGKVHTEVKATKQAVKAYNDAIAADSGPELFEEGEVLGEQFDYANIIKNARAAVKTAIVANPDKGKNAQAQMPEALDTLVQLYDAVGVDAQQFMIRVAGVSNLKVAHIDMFEEMLKDASFDAFIAGLCAHLKVRYTTQQ